MLINLKHEYKRFTADEGGFIESDWLMIAGIIGGALSLSSYFGYNIGHIVAQAFDDMVMTALRKVGI